jgi:hypothetical protein
VEGRTTKCFRPINREVAINIGTIIPNFVKPFKMHTDANDFVIGGIVMQKGQPITFKSKKLARTQLKRSYLR